MITRDDFHEFHEEGFVKVLRYVVNEDKWITMHIDENDQFVVILWQRVKPGEKFFVSMNPVSTRFFNCLKLALILANRWANKEE
jgi:hypothetical protein